MITNKNICICIATGKQYKQKSAQVNFTSECLHTYKGHITAKFLHTCKCILLPNACTPSTRVHTEA